MKSDPAIDRFMSRMAISDQEYNGTPCWEWLGRKDDGGYGDFDLDNKSIKAHIFSYEYLIGPRSNELELDHLCRNRSCVNSTHLEQVTHRENILRGLSFAARNAKKTHCPSGHEYTPENTRMLPNNSGRRCRTCHRLEYKPRSLK
jgi:hypothetical protein